MPKSEMPNSNSAIYFIRHGQSEFNAIFDQDKPDPMIFDAHLSQLGRQQATGLQLGIKKLMITRVIVSPLIRTLQTASLIFGENYPFEVNPLVREQVCNSCDVGSHPEELGQTYPHLDFGHLEERWWHDEDKDHRGVSVEPDELLCQRADSFIAGITANNGHATAIVSHGNFIRAATGIQPENCEIVRFEPIRRIAQSVEVI
jgi:broad specificity phosphatase PhoE